MKEATRASSSPDASGGMKVLIVAEDVHLGSMLRQGLYGSHDVFQVASASAAIDTLMEYSFDAIMAEVELTGPGLNGHELLAVVAKLRPDMRRIVCTCLATVDSPGMADALLRRPFTPAQLRDALCPPTVITHKAA